ncbi:MAG TPA: leucine-rich repeat protein, partial [Prolixibacteraceae bacterium]
MKKIIILTISVCFSLISHAQVSKTQTINAGKLSFALTSIEKSTITNLTLTGTIDARDFKTMRDSMNVLAVVDISGTTIVDYTGTEGTWTNIVNYYYPSNTMPSCSFYDINKNIAKTCLTSIQLPLSVASIDGMVFYDCTGLTSVNIPSLVTSIGGGAFGGCTGLTSVAIPPSVKFIGAETFMRCSELKSINIPSITAIGMGTFLDCKSLTSINIPSSVTLIANEAFVNCSGLTSLTIPSTVDSICSNAFQGCTGLTSIYVRGLTPLDLSPSTDVFKLVDKTACILHVPYGTTGFYAAANQWKDFTNIIEMPGIKLSSVNEVIEAAQGSTGSIEITSDFTWAASSDQTWLTINPTIGTGTKQTLAFTTEANASTTDQRVAKITISAPDQISQTITVTQKITIDPTKLDAFEPDNSVDQAGIIKSGDIQQHSIYPFEDIDYASFDLTNAPAQVEVKFNTIYSGHQIQLLAADGSTVLSTDNTLINTTLTQNGKYYIKAWNPDSLLIPGYQLCLKIIPIVVDRYEPDNTWQEAKLITPFTEQDDHTIKTIGDVDYVKFTISDAPRTIYADVTDNRKECKNFGIWLYDTNGTTILNYSNAPKINCGAYQEYTLIANGTYFLKVGLPQGESGSTRDDYTIKLTTNCVAPSITCNPADSLALVAIYNTMNGANWTRKLNWLTGQVQNWQGVTLSSEGRVTKLNLTCNNLQGSMPTEIGQLTALRFLNLGNIMFVESWDGANQLIHCTLPVSMTSLVSLEVLSLDGLNFNSELTDVFSGMVKLRELYLNQNGFTNTQLPAGILSCSKLERLAIDGNFFSQLPDITGLTNLQSFSAYSNLFTFEDIEPNWTISGFNYSPQHKLGQAQALNPETGTEVTYTIEVGGAHNLYQWYKNDLPIPGQTSNTLKIENVSKADAGLYHLCVTNSLATQLTLYSETLTLYQKELPIYKTLEAFYESTGGANWSNNANWLSDAPLTSWDGIYENDSGQY